MPRNRMQLVVAGAVFAVCGLTAAVPPASSGLMSSDQQAAHVLNRLTFGARPGDLDRVKAMGVQKWIDQQLNPERIPDARLDQFLSDNYESLSLSADQVLAKYPSPQAMQAEMRRQAGGDSARLRAIQQSPELRMARQQANRVNNEIQSATVARAVLSERQLNEIMVDFWENHFSVFQGKGQVRSYLVDYDRDAIRPYAMGNFRDLLGHVAKSPAMLFYLDNWQSVADSGRPTLAPVRRQQGRPVVIPRVGRPGQRPGIMPPILPPVQQRPAAQQQRRGLNENYGRELMELHTLGVDGGYTQEDVINVARALTGWTIQNPQQGGGFVFRPEVHDAGPKTVLGVKMPSGRGIEDGEQVLDIVANNPATARFIATKLVRRFVSDTPPAALVNRAAATFTRTKGDIRETLRTILTSQEFFSESAYRSKVRTPFEVVVATLRAMDARPDPTQQTAQRIAQLGQPIFGKETPNGWPDVGDAWLNTGSILSRINFGLSAASGQVPGVSVAAWSEAPVLRAASHEAQVNGVIDALLSGDASPETRAILLTGENPFLTAHADSAATLMASMSTDTAAAMDDSGGMTPAAPGRGGAPGRAGAAGRAGAPGRAGAVAGQPQAGQPQRAALALGRQGGGARNNNKALPDLQGLPQVVGLALGSPEFQRR